MEATLELLQRHGVTGLSIEAVAQRAGVAKTTIYRRWPGKAELVLDVLTHVRGTVIPLPQDRPVREVLEIMLETVWEERRDPRRGGGAVLRRLIAEIDVHPEMAAQYLARVVVPRRAQLMEVLRRGVREGEIRPDADLDLVAETLIAPVLLGAWMHSGTRIERYSLPGLIDLVLTGVAPAAGPGGCDDPPGPARPSA